MGPHHAHYSLLYKPQLLPDFLGRSRHATSDAKKTMAAGTQMWNSKVFTEDQMLSWENKLAIDQTWPNLQTYFTKK
jgi:hypothetical protein